MFCPEGRRAGVRSGFPGLANFFGDVIGHQIAVGLKGFGQQLKATGENLQQVAGEYLNSEQSPMAQAEELRHYANEVDRLRDAADRLEARMRKLREPS